jgi:excinuclease ABC subunit C
MLPQTASATLRPAGISAQVSRGVYTDALADTTPRRKDPNRIDADRKSGGEYASSWKKRMNLPDPLLEKLETLPAQPGCYLFKDKKGQILYVGKAKSLRSRVKSYFQESSGDDRFFIPILQRTVGDFETLVTASEKEAAILEDSLVKKHQPRYNVKLRDDKSYLCLRIRVDHAWPRVEPVRRPSPDGARYFGPYHSATAARRTLQLVNKHFQLRTCSDQDLESRKRPCLQYQIRRCLAPCVYDVDRQWYEDQVRAVGLFLDGRHDELSQELGDRMKGASKNLEFELAATYRDQLRAVEAIRQEQRVVAVKDIDQDIVALFREGDLVEIAVLFIRGGRVTDTAHFPIHGVELPDDEVTAAFVSQFYGEGGGAAVIPDEVVVSVAFEGADGVGEWLSERRGRRCAIVVPQRGARVDLVRMAQANAEHAFREQRRAVADVEERLAQVQKRLRLPTLPRRIECCDISHLGGTDTVGAVVALLDGQPDKKRYRTFRVRTVAPGDDYGAMYEVLARRFRRGRAAEEAKRDGATETETQAEGTRDQIDWDLPDLFVVDGGRGQLNVALAAARDLGLHELPIVALAKEKNIPGYPGHPLDPASPPDPERSEEPRDTAETLPEADEAAPPPLSEPGPVSEAPPVPEAPVSGKRKGRAAQRKKPDDLVDRVYLPGQKNGIPLKPNSAPLFFLARARDEAHRFSNRARERLGKARKLRSDLDDIPGIGPVTRRSLLRTLGSLAAIRCASDEALLAVPGVNQKTLRALRAYFPAPAAPASAAPAPAAPTSAAPASAAPPPAPSASPNPPAETAPDPPTTG